MVGRAILVTGAEGRLARALQRSGDPRVRTLARSELDVTDLAAISAAIDRLRPGFLINTAATSSVEAAETDPDRAFPVNAVAPGLLARCCAERGVPLVHISTDYVFGGGPEQPRREDDAIAPVNAYGRMKAEGERRALASAESVCVVRVAWLFGDGEDFIARLLQAGTASPARVAEDQVGSPTPIQPLAARLIELGDRMASGERIPTVLHLAGSPPVSRADWVAAAFEGLERVGLEHPPLSRARLADFPSAAARPRFSALDCSRSAGLFGAALEWGPSTASPQDVPSRWTDVANVRSWAEGERADASLRRSARERPAAAPGAPAVAKPPATSSLLSPSWSCRYSPGPCGHEVGAHVSARLGGSIAYLGIALVAAAWLTTGRPAFAACTLKTASIPVAMVEGAPVAAAKIDDVPVSFALDSRRSYDSVTKGVALDIVKTPRAQPAAADAGALPLAVTGELLIAGLSLKNAAFATSEFDQNILGTRILGRADVEFDFAHSVLNLVFPQDCKMDVLAYWAAPGQTYSMMPLEPALTAAPDISAPVTVNGVRLRAVFETAQPASYVTARAAARAKLVPAGANGSAAADAPVVRRFDSLKVGDEEIKGGLIQVLEDDIETADLVIGSDFLLAYHIYVARSQDRIYLTYNGGRVFDTTHRAKGRPAPHPTQVVRPEWVRRPTGEDMAAHYPPEAVRQRVSGDAVIRCRTAADGLLKDCVVISESPQGMGFGAASLALSDRFKFAAGRGEHSLEGGIVTIPIAWRILD